MSHRPSLDCIATYCADAALPWDDGRAAQMAHYLDLLMQFNQAMNLIGPMSPPEIVEYLLLDSLVATAARQPQGPILDVGCGAGLPGIPIKIVYPESAITLVEPRRKRSTFLKVATHRLGLNDVDIFRGRIEDFQGQDFDTVISKAFQAPTTWLATARPFIADDGAVIVMGRQSDRPDLIDTAQRLGLPHHSEARGAGGGEDQRVCYAFSP